MFENEDEKKEYIRKEADMIDEHLKNVGKKDVPREERNRAVLEWIQKHAQQYRHQWHEKRDTDERKNG